MTRLPVLPTVLVAMAVAAMVALGIWQLQRMAWKDALLDRYRAAATQPPVAWPARPDAGNAPLFRRSSADCAAVIAWRAASGRNRQGESGFSHVATCRPPDSGAAPFQADLGWSRTPASPDWTGGRVSGVIAPDSRHVVRLIADTPAPGLLPSAVPSPEDIPNNHLAYAVQWFLFAAAAAIIYLLALRRRNIAPGGLGR